MSNAPKEYNERGNLSEEVEDPIIRENVDKKTLYFLAIAVAVATLLMWFVYYQYSQNNALVSSDSQSSNETRVLSVEGVVLSVDSANNELSVVLSSNKEGVVKNEDLEGQTKKIKISPSTVVQKLVVSRGEDNLIDRSDSVEVNLSDINKGDRLIIEYVGLKKDDVIEQAKNISVVIETKTFEETLAEVAKLSSGPFLGIKGKVVSYDESKSMVTYHPYSLDKLSDSTAVAILKDGSNLFSINSESRLDISHAKQKISWADIKAEDTIFIVLDRELELTEENQKNMTAESFLLVK